jgi:hypothetical protein
MRIRPVHYALAIAIFVAAAALLNPSAEQHRKKIRQAVADRSQLAALLHLGYHSLGLASYTTANGKVLSVGAFGIVIIPETSQDP